MIRKKLRMLSLLSVMLCSVAASAQHKVEMIPFGNMDQWIDRQIKESGIIGGATKNVFAIGPTATITENKAYTNMGGSPWATSNVMARVAGITKTMPNTFTLSIRVSIRAQKPSPRFSGNTEVLVLVMPATRAITLEVAHGEPPIFLYGLFSRIVAVGPIAYTFLVAPPIIPDSLIWRSIH